MGTMLHDPSLSTAPKTIDELFRAVRVSPLRTAFDKPASILFWLGIALLSTTIISGFIALGWPNTKPTLKIVAEWSFLGGFGIVCLSWILGLAGFLTGVSRHVSKRFEASHTTSAKLAEEIAASFPIEKIRSRLHSIRLELKLNARAPGKIPIATGLITAFAAASRYLISVPTTAGAKQTTEAAMSASQALPTGASALEGAGAVLPELAWIVIGISFGSFVARIIIHDTQDRLMRTEGLLEKAETLASGEQPAPTTPKPKRKRKPGPSDAVPLA